jgi:hypothetical protein
MYVRKDIINVPITLQINLNYFSPAHWICSRSCLPDRYRITDPSGI